MKNKLQTIFTLFLVLVVQLTIAQEKTISGTVTDENGMPMSGVNVIIKNTRTGTQTDFDGIYSIKANIGDVLNFSYIGKKVLNSTVSAEDVIDVKMEKSAESLDEVMVVAYGVSNKRSFTGAAETVYSAFVCFGWSCN